MVGEDEIIGIEYGDLVCGGDLECLVVCVGWVGIGD